MGNKKRQNKLDSLASNLQTGPAYSWRNLFAVICLIFFCSGLTALVYQVVWVRLLTLSFGASTFAVTAVLMAFMGGMSAGALFFGRRADRSRNPLKLYAILELVIGLYALALPFLLEATTNLYIMVYRTFEPDFYTMSLVRLLASIIILLVPTAAMGGTLPILCSLLGRRQETAARNTARLYAVNTFGGVAGCVGAGFVLVPYLGLNGATYLSVAVNLVIAVAAWFCSRPVENNRPVASEPDHAKRPRLNDKEKSALQVDRLLIAAAVLAIALSGFAAMAYETLWTRVLCMVVGTTVYAFSTMLAAFLMGIVLGSVLYVWLPIRRHVLWFGLTQFGLCLWGLGFTPYFDELPFVFLRIFEWSHSNWSLFQFMRFIMLFGILLVPTTLFGLSFPLAVRIVIQRSGETGERVGLLYGANTIGAILGAFTGGFLLIPFLGAQQGIIILATINLFVGLMLISCEPALYFGRKVSLGGAASAVAVILALFISPWELAYINSGPYVYAHDYTNTQNLRRALKAYKTVFYKEGPAATVSVIRSPRGPLSLTIDGKTDASTGHNADMSTQVLLSHLPAMFVEEPEEALLIGVGSGVSLGSLLQHPVTHVDAVEISPAVIKATSFFREYNHNALDDPRVNLVIGDGRHHMERTPQKYDLIISQPSNPWISGVSSLFTRDYYQLMMDRLSDRGVVCQWIPSYHMSKKMLAIICKTWTDVFPNSSMWTSSVVGDLFLIGSKENIELDYKLFLKRLKKEKINQDLARIDMNSPELLAQTFKYDRQGIQQFIDEFDSGDLPVNTDMFPVLEYMSPHFLLTERLARDFGKERKLTGDLANMLNVVDPGSKNNLKKIKNQFQAAKQ
jgi:spermidine synthase